MSGYLTIKPKNEKVPSQAAVDKAALREANAALAPLTDTFRAIRRQGLPIPAQQAGPARVFARDAGLTSSLVQQGGLFYRGRLAGFGGPPETPSADGLEFLPKTTKVRVGEKVTWTTGNGHTISFDVPNYFPIFTIRPEGTVVRNPRLDPPAGGSPKIPAEDKDGNMIIDAGTWDGRHFLSSGLLNPDGIAAYTVRFGKPGTYKYACLVHPGMVGTVVVTP
jgi:plastocyanin